MKMDQDANWTVDYPKSWTAIKQVAPDWANTNCSAMSLDEQLHVGHLFRAGFDY